MIRSLALALAMFALAGCAAIEVADYRNEHPVLDLAGYFNGTVDGWGMFQDRSGKVLKRFHVRIDCTWQGAEGTLDELRLKAGRGTSLEDVFLSLIADESPAT